jgi:AcrR family transcriptional regulator
MTRRSAAQTRALLIDTALGMLHERGPVAGVGHIRLSDVVERAGLTTGAAYRLWDDQRAFHGELAIAAVRWRDAMSTAKTIARIEDAVAAGAPWPEVVRLGADANLHQFPEDIAFLTSLALRASAYGDPELVTASRERNRSALAAYGELYDAMLLIYRRRMKAPFTLQHLCSAFAALAEGFGLQAASGEPHPRVHLESPDDRTGSDWSLLAVAVVALLEHLTEPCPD